MSHTPGPWECVLDDDGETCTVTFIVRMGSHLGGANGYQPQHRIEYEVAAPEEALDEFCEAEANARLIAAAPDLLSALKEAVSEFAHLEGMNDRGVEVRCVAAIAKAEGR